MTHSVKSLSNVTLILISAGLFGSGCTSMRNVADSIVPPRPSLLATRSIVPPPAPEPTQRDMVFSMPSPTATAITPISPKIDSGLSLPPVIESKTLTYTVQKNDYLSKIAKLHGISYKELAAFNNIDPKAILPVGKVLRIPPGGKAPSATTISEAKTTSQAPAKKAAPKKTTRKITRQPIPANGKHIVASGDSLWVIARRYGLKTNDLRTWNNLSSDTLQIGQVLVLRASASVAPKKYTAPISPAPTVTTQPKTMPESPAGLIEPPAVPTAPAIPTSSVPKTLKHNVTASDTLEDIADMYDVSVEAIKQANPGLTDNSQLKSFSTVVVPFK